MMKLKVSTGVGNLVLTSPTSCQIRSRVSRAVQRAVRSASRNAFSRSQARRPTDGRASSGAAAPLRVCAARSVTEDILTSLEAVAERVALEPDQDDALDHDHEDDEEHHPGEHVGDREALERLADLDPDAGRAAERLGQR